MGLHLNDHGTKRIAINIISLIKRLEQLGVIPKYVLNEDFALSTENRNAFMSLSKGSNILFIDIDTTDSHAFDDRIGNNALPAKLK